MSRLILFNKPYGVLTQFTDPDGRPTLADFIPIPKVYAAGRLDADSEGLVVLTDDGAQQARIADPRHKLAKTYRVQVEGLATDEALRQLSTGWIWAIFEPGRVRPALFPNHPGFGSATRRSVSRGNSDKLAGNRPAGRQEPPGQAHDGKSRLSYPAPDPLGGGRLDTGRAPGWTVART